MPAASTWLPRMAARSNSGIVRGICGASSSTIRRFFGLPVMFFSLWRPAGTLGSSVIRPCSCRKVSARASEVASLGTATVAPLGRAFRSLCLAEYSPSGALGTCSTSTS